MPSALRAVPSALTERRRGEGRPGRVIWVPYTPYPRRAGPPRSSARRPARRRGSRGAAAAPSRRCGAAAAPRTPPPAPKASGSPTVSALAARRRPRAQGARAPPRGPPRWPPLSPLRLAALHLRLSRQPRPPVPQPPLRPPPKRWPRGSTTRSRLQRLTTRQPLARRSAAGNATLAGLWGRDSTAPPSAGTAVSNSAIPGGGRQRYRWYSSGRRRFLFSLQL